MPKHKAFSNDSHDGKADLPTNVKLRAFRCQDFAEMTRQDRLAYGNAVLTAIRAENQRRGQSYKPKFNGISQCVNAYEAHMEEQRKRKLERFWSAPLKPLPVFEPELIAEPIVIPKPAKISILPTLLAEHFDVNARKLAGHLIYQAQQEQVDREADIAVAVTNFCIELGI